MPSSPALTPAQEIAMMAKLRGEWEAENGREEGEEKGGLGGVEILPVDLGTKAKQDLVVLEADKVTWDGRKKSFDQAKRDTKKARGLSNEDKISTPLIANLVPPDSPPSTPESDKRGIQKEGKLGKHK
jgi:hypothetical protein